MSETSEPWGDKPCAGCGENLIGFWFAVCLPESRWRTDLFCRICAKSIKATNRLEDQFQAARVLLAEYATK